MALALVSPPPAWLATPDQTAASLTTAAFTPPAGALLLSQSTFGTSNSARTEATTTVTGTTSAWTKVLHQNTGAGLVDSNWTTVTTSASTTVRTTWPVAFDGSLAVFVVTGQRTTGGPIGQSGSGQSVTGGGFSFTVTPTVAGSRVFVSYCDVAGGSAPTSAQMTSYGTAQPSSRHASYVSGELTGATTITFTGGSANAAYNWVEIVPATATAPAAPVVNAGADASVQTGTAFTRTATETNSPTSRSWTIVSGPTGAGTTIGTAAALSWTPTTLGSYVLRYSATNATGTGTDDVTVTVTAAAGPDISSPKLKEAILRFVSTVENGNQEWWTHFGYIEYGAGIGDTRGYTGGIVGWTTATFDMNVLIKAYTAATPTNPLAKWIPTLNTIDAMSTQQQRHDASLTQLGAAFVADWQAAAETTAFKQAQLAERDRAYWDRAYGAAVADGGSPLLLQHYYDTVVNHGWNPGEAAGGPSFQGLVATAKSTAAAPAAGGDEGTYLTALNNARETILRGWGDWQDDGRVPALRNFVALGNFTLATPYSWSMYGTTHTITAWPDPYQLPLQSTGVTYRNGSTQDADGGAALVIPKATGLAVGDLMVSAWTGDRDLQSSVAIPALSGWTTAGTLERFSGTPDVGALRIAWKIATQTDVNATSTTFPTPTPNLVDVAGAINVFTAGTFNPAAPIADLTFAVDSTSQATHTAPTATGVAGGMLLNVWTRSDNSQPASTVTWTTTADQLRTQMGATGMWVGIATATTPLSTAGATGTRSATATDASPSLMASVVIAPPPGAQAATRTATSTAAATDSVTRSLGAGRTAASSAGASDTHSWTRGKGATGSSAAGATDSAAYKLDRGRTIVDVAAATDHVTWKLSRPDIADYQFVFDTEPWTPFGLGQTIVVENFDPGTAETRSQDILSSVSDTRIFGTDRRTPPTWSFDLYTDVETPEAALEWAQNMEEVWDAEGLRRTPNAVVALRYKIAGRIRRVYGRPRDFTPIPTYVRTGRVHMAADFALAENTFYDDTEDTLTVRTDPTVGGQTTGFTFPVTFPLTIGGYREQAARTEIAQVYGKRPTWVDLTITGPTIDPWVRIGDLRWALRGELGNGETLTLSGKPWQQGIFGLDDTPRPGLLDPRARLSQLRIKPGTYPVSFGGYDPTGSSKATLAWRSAYGTL